MVVVSVAPPAAAGGAGLAQLDLEGDARAEAVAFDELGGDDRVGGAGDKGLVEHAEPAIGAVEDFEDASGRVHADLWVVAGLVWTGAAWEAIPSEVSDAPGTPEARNPESPELGNLETCQARLSEPGKGWKRRGTRRLQRRRSPPSPVKSLWPVSRLSLLPATDSPLTRPLRTDGGLRGAESRCPVSRSPSVPVISANRLGWKSLHGLEPPNRLHIANPRLRGHGPSGARFSGFG